MVISESIRAVKHHFTKRTLRLLLKLWVFFLLLQTIPVLIFLCLQLAQTVLDIRTTNNNFVDRIASKISYKNGIWNVDKYSADITTPHPHGTGGFTDPLYIVTADGFVIERNALIPGFLDSTNLQKLQQYNEPTTVSTLTNEKWRIRTIPIGDRAPFDGLIVAAYYAPFEDSLEEIDQKLNASLETIDNRLSQVKGNSLSGVDFDDVPYDVSFEIITNFNKILSNNGRIPSYIDPSYVADQIENYKPLQFYRTESGESFVLVARIIRDESNTPIGIIISGQPLTKYFYTIRDSAGIFFLITAFSSLILSLAFLVYTIGHREGVWYSLFYRVSKKELPESIMYDPKTGVLLLDHEIKVEFPSDTHQYSMVTVLLKNPRKKWGQDELARQMNISSQTPNIWRTLYDASIIINRKIGFKLVEYKNKEFSLNPSTLKSIG